MRRDYGASGDSGDLKHCRSNQYHSQYRDHAALYQLRRNFGGISAWRDGAGTECQQNTETVLNGLQKQK